MVQCSAVQCSAVQCSAVQCSTVYYSILECSVVHLYEEVSVFQKEEAAQGPQMGRQAVLLF